MKLPECFFIDNAPSIYPASILEADGCKWPLEGKKGVLFCNDRTDTPLESYCTYHAKLAYAPSKRKAHAVP